MMRDDVTEFRRYERSDLDAIVDLDAACFSSPFRFSKAAMRRFAEAQNAWVLVAQAQRVIIGFCIVHLEQVQGNAVGYVVTIDVAEAFRRGSVGEQMLTEGEAWTRASGGVAMLLHVYVKNDGAVRFYERRGYERVEVEPDFYGFGIDAAMYWKNLQKA